MSVKISVVTICYNAADVIRTTMESVLAQDYDDFEYIIQDGNSADATPEIASEFKKKFDAKGIRFIYVRERDGGIYDAMNRAMNSVTGRYVNYMNAGDCFYSDSALSDAARTADAADDGTKPFIAYGDCAVYEYGRFYLFAKSLEDIYEKMPFSHQSAFASSDFLRAHPFNVSYRYSADYDFLLTARDLDAAFADIGKVVCITTADGTSSINYHDTLMESAMILKAHGRYAHSDAEFAKTGKILSIKQFVLDHFPVFIRKMIRAAQIKSRGQSFEAAVPPWFHMK